MALSNAEKQRRYRERRAKSAQTVAPASLPVKRTFAEFINSDEYRVEAFDTAMDILDSGRLAGWDKWIEADNAVDICLDFIGSDYDGAIMAITTVCALVNEYKVEQIDARLREIEEATHDNPSLKEAADKFAAHLREVRAQYQRRNRYELMPMEVKGEKED